ncbi:hypothetical protein BD779DRAFT_1515920 [Infundibulicybe gibba]|nr:hypothetical protein BD779DRAFT_1515920 [Infundibulicybe gibba]
MPLLNAPKYHFEPIGNHSLIESIFIRRFSRIPCPDTLLISGLLCVRSRPSTFRFPLAETTAQQFSDCDPSSSSARILHLCSFPLTQESYLHSPTSLLLMDEFLVAVHLDCYIATRIDSHAKSGRASGLEIGGKDSTQLPGSPPNRRTQTRKAGHKGTISVLNINMGYSNWRPGARDRIEESKTIKAKQFMNLLMQLRRVCNHLYLSTNAEPNPYHLGEHIVAASSKLIAIDQILADILPKGGRVLILSLWTGYVAHADHLSSMLDLHDDFLNLRSVPCARLGGSTRRPRRALDIRLARNLQGPTACLKLMMFQVSAKSTS